MALIDCEAFEKIRYSAQILPAVSFKRALKFVLKTVVYSLSVLEVLDEEYFFT